jgi:hypothetical protein
MLNTELPFKIFYFAVIRKSARTEKEEDMLTSVPQDTHYTE